MSKSADTIYFQKQTFLDNSCGLCALNNLMGKKAFTYQDLTQICRNISPDSIINPYKSLFGGDFDVSALILALQTHDVSVRWLKEDDDISQLLVSDRLKGFLINADQKKNKMFTKLFNQSGRHWTCLTKTGNKFFYMDSQKDTYEECEDLNHVLATVLILKQRG